VAQLVRRIASSWDLPRLQRRDNQDIFLRRNISLVATLRTTESRVMRPMLCNRILLISLLSAATATAAQAPVDRGSWELTLAATGTSNKDFDEHAIGINAGLGYFFFDHLELTLRQTGVYVKSEATTANGSTQFALDWHFPLGRRGEIQPFIGANAGYFYGDTFTDTFEYAPEAGVKYFVNPTTFIFFRAEYQIFAKDFTGNSDSADRQYTYGIGIGFRF
jgi:hypothetical protein